MPLPPVVLELPSAPAPRGVPLTIALRLGDSSHPVGALVANLRIPDHLCGAVSVSPVAFSGPGDAGLEVRGPLGDMGLYRVAGAGLGESAGPLEVAVVTLTPGALAGGDIPLEAEVVEAFALDGRPLRFAPFAGALAVAAEALAVESTTAGARAGVPFLSALRARGGTPAYTWTHDGGALPPGVEFDPAGFLRGTPGAEGEFSVDVTVADSADPPRTATATVVVEVAAPPLVVETRALPPAAEGTPYAADLASSGGEGEVTWSASGLPSGLAVSGARIEGTLQQAPADFSPAQVVLTATDGSSPPLSAERTVGLPFVAILPDGVVATDPVARVVPGRDLHLVDYRVELRGEILHPGRDEALHEAIDEARSAILDELVSVLDCTPGVGGGGPIPYEDALPPDRHPAGEPGYPGGTGAPDGGGHGGGFGPGGDPGWGGGGFGPTEPPVEDPCLGLSFPGHDDGPTITRGSDYVRALMAWYRELGSWKRGTAPVSFDVCIDVDGDEILCGGLGLKKTLAMKLNATDALGRASRGAGSRASRSLSVLREPVRWLLRGPLERAIEELFSRGQPPGPRAPTAEPARERAGKARPAEGDAAPPRTRPAATAPPAAPPGPPGRVVRLPMDRGAFEGLRAALAADRARKRSAPERRLSRWGAAAALLTATMVAGVGGLLWSGLALLAAASVSSWVVARRISRRLKEATPLLEGLLGSIVEEDPPDAEAAVTLTPGAHRVTARWTRTTHGSSGYAGAGESPSMSFQATFRPSNPGNWPRLEGETVVARGGIRTSGSRDFDVSLTRSDVDLLVVTQDGRLRLHAARGDGGFAEAAEFAPGTFHPEHVAVARLDAIGRTSVVGVSESALRIWYNDGIRGFTTRSATRAQLGVASVHSLAAARLDPGEWRRLVLGSDSTVVTVGGLAENVAAGAALEAETSLPDFAVDGEAVSALAAFPEGEGLDGLVATGRFGGQALLLAPGTDGTLESDGALAGLDAFDPARLPSAACVLERSGHLLLAVALRQRKRLKVYRREGGAWEAEGEALLPARPSGLVPAPGDQPAWLVSTDLAGLVLMVERRDDGPLHVAPAAGLLGAPTLGHDEGLVAMAVGGGEEVLLFR